MVFFDASAPYRARVNEFNASSFYGTGIIAANIIDADTKRSDNKSAGGLNETAQTPSYWAIDNPHTSVSAQLDKTIGDIGLWNTKYKVKEIDTMQYIQPPQYHTIKNKWTEHLEEIEANRVPFRPYFNGNGNLTLEVDTNV